MKKGFAICTWTDGYSRNSLLICMAILFWNNDITAREYDLFATAGINHHLFFSKPTYVFDKNYIDRNGPPFKYYPTFGDYFGIGIEKNIGNNFYAKLSFEYERYHLLLKTDSASANYNRRYFFDPLIEIDGYINLICSPIYLTYKFGIYSFDLGLLPSIFVWGRTFGYSIDGRKTEQAFTDKALFLDNAISFKINIQINNAINLNFGYDKNIKNVIKLNFLRIGISYSFFKIKAK